MPGGRISRTTRAHDFILLLTKGNKYFYNANAIKETTESGSRNARSVWTIAAQPVKGHFATFPEEIPRRAILAGSRPGDTVLDCFMGSGTTGVVARRLGRKFIGIDLNPRYVKLARRRIEEAAKRARMPLRTI
jgi:site-specific DNA-methyltransferase (cytosine-N4-specific)